MNSYAGGTGQRPTRTELAPRQGPMWMGIVGATIIGVGALLPWAPIGVVSTIGTSGDGALTLIGGLIIAWLAVAGGRDPWGANIPSAGQAALRRPVGPSRARSSEASIARLGRTKRSEDPADMTKSARTKGIAVFV